MTWHWTHNSWFPWVHSVHCCVAMRLDAVLVTCLKLGADPTKWRAARNPLLRCCEELRRVHDQYLLEFGAQTTIRKTNTASHSPCSYRPKSKIFLQSIKEKGDVVLSRMKSPQRQRNTTHGDLLASRRDNWPVPLDTRNLLRTQVLLD